MKEIATQTGDAWLEQELSELKLEVTGFMELSGVCPFAVDPENKTEAPNTAGVTAAGVPLFIF